MFLSSSQLLLDSILLSISITGVAVLLAFRGVARFPAPLYPDVLPDDHG